VAGGLEPHAEAAGDQVDVIGPRLGFAQEGGIEPVAHRFKGGGGGGGLRLGQLARQQVGPLGRLAQASLHGDDGPRNGGHVRGEFPQLGRGGGRAWSASAARRSVSSRASSASEKSCTSTSAACCPPPRRSKPCPI
jgi:hypothetical protein